MKKLAVVCMFCWLASCQSTQKLLYHTWKVDDVQIIDPDNRMPQQGKDMIANGLKNGVTITFMPDSTYKIYSGEQIVNSTWWLSKDKKSFFAKTADGQIVESKIEELKPGYFKVSFPPAKGMPGYVLTCSPTQ